MLLIVETRFLSSVEASYNLCAFNLHDRSHTVYRLAVHLEDAQNVIFHPDQIEDSLDRELFRKTMLTGWFELNKQDLPSNPQQFKYIDIPYHYTWNKKEWKERVQDGNKVISRMYHINPNQGELFYLRTLLLHVTGCISFQCIRSYNGVVYPSFKSACVARNLLEDDNQWFETLRESATFKMPSQMRILFATICNENEPTNPEELFDTFINDMIEDFMHGKEDSYRETAINNALKEINKFFNKFGKNNQHFNLPMPVVSDEPLDDGSLLSQEQNRLNSNECIQLLNIEQKSIFNQIVESIRSNNPTKCFYVDGPGGTGKTFLIKVTTNLRK